MGPWMIAFQWFNLLGSGAFLTNTGFAFSDRAKQETQQRNGGTKVRVWIGQDDNVPDMTGHIPDFETYNYNGDPVGTYHGKGKVAAAGGYVDIMIPNYPHHPHMEPYYLKMYAGGDNGICISSLAITGPNEIGLMYWPELLIDCSHEVIGNGHHDSYTLVGDRGQKPKCLWFDRDHSYGLKLTELTLHLPDLQMEEEKAKRWRENKEIFCHPSPRMLPAYNEGPKGLFDPIWTFDPPLEYNETTGIDTDPSRILKWKPDDSQLGLSDKKLPSRHGMQYTNIEDLRKKITEMKPATKIRGLARRFLRNKRADEQDDEASTSSFPAFGNSTVTEEELVMYDEARRLVILNSALNRSSAAIHCTHRSDDPDPHHHIKRGAQDNPDYLSYDEGIYCDTLMKTMYSLCNDVNKHLCFDADIKMLRRFDNAPDPEWVEHDAIITDKRRSEDHKREARQKRAERAAAKIASDNEIAKAKGIPITYKPGQPRPLWGRPYHHSKITHVQEDE